MFTFKGAKITCRAQK